ncbi:MAG TPA: diacylglycerol kinase family protein [Streptosporangiaceae bacterium]|nr:diacylglycerol kinase family protein [Streptosporangiaceae bacterium]
MEGEARRAALVVNAARVPDVRRLCRACERATAASGWGTPLVLLTTPADAGSGLTRDALAAGADLVIVAGGDGTVRACAEVLAGTGVPMAIVPAGSANLTANALGLPLRTDAALRVAFGGRDRQIDLAVADGMTFAAMAGIGVDAAVVGATPDAAKRLAGWPAYAAAAAGQLLGRPATFTVRLDGGEPMIRPARSVTVGNSGALPGGFLIMPGARLDDGLLDVLVLAPAGPLGWANVGYRVLIRSRRDDLRLERYRASSIEISADADLPRQVDGEMIAPGRSLTVAVRPGALLVRVPG